MGLATAVTVGVGTGACGSEVITSGSGGAGGESSVSSSMGSSPTSSSAMMSATFVAAYGPPPTFCESSATTITAVSGLGEFCYSCAEFSCCPELEACGNDCAACLDDTTTCATPGAQSEADALIECLGNGDCGPECALTEVCDSGFSAPTADCAECASDNCCPAFTACSQDTDCLDCFGGDMVACEMTMADDDVSSCVEASCEAACN